MIIIGINAYHADSSACLVIDGKLISAIEEEKFSIAQANSPLNKNGNADIPAKPVSNPL